MDGLSGFKIYNKLHISTRFLPRNYSDTLDFLITGITHDLKDNDWETSIQTTVIPKTTKVEDLNIDLKSIQESVANVNSANSSGTRRRVDKTSTYTTLGSNRPVIVESEKQKQLFEKYYGTRFQDLYPNSSIIVRKGVGNQNSYVETFRRYLEIQKNKGINNIKIKTSGGYQLGNGGDISKDLYTKLTKFNETLSESKYNSIKKPILITGGNDAFHHGRAKGIEKYENQNGKPWRTTHTRGLGIDIRSSNVDSDNLIIDALEASGFTGIIWHGPVEHIHANIQ